MSSLSTHVLDTMHGRPAAGIELVLLGPDGRVIAQGCTNDDGRCPDLARTGLEPGCYAISFAVADYFRAKGVDLPDPPFLDVVTVDFGIAAEGGHYHVPLLVSPYGYSTYRGS
jgi:5-hydroxyisourate hydrolase